MILDATSPEFEIYFQPSIEVTNLEGERFYGLLEVVNIPLWERCIVTPS